MGSVVAGARIWRETGFPIGISGAMMIGWVYRPGVGFATAGGLAVGDGALGDALADEGAAGDETAPGQGPCPHWPQPRRG